MNEKNYIERYWRDAKPEDAIKDPPMVARLRDSDKLKWSNPCELRGWIRRNTYQWISESGAWSHCQVYDAPDPGEGWRLVDIEKDDCNQDGIEYWNSGEKAWLPRNHRNDKTTFLEGGLYRTRITPTVTYVPFTWEDREQLRGRWVYRDRDDYVLEEVAFKFDSRAFDVVAKHLLDDGWKFCDTKKPVGKEVTQ